MSLDTYFFFNSLQKIQFSPISGNRYFFIGDIICLMGMNMPGHHTRLAHKENNQLPQNPALHKKKHNITSHLHRHFNPPCPHHPIPVTPSPPLPSNPPTPPVLAFNQRFLVSSCKGISMSSNNT